MKLLSILLSVAGVSSLVWVFPVVAEVETFHETSTAADLIAQGVTRVTGVEVIQTAEGLELVLETVAGSERLVPLIVPEGNDLVIDILNATLAFSIRNGVTELNPAPGISRVTVDRGEENSIQVRITGENQTPSAKVVPGREDLVLSIAPEGATAEQEPDEEIEVIATGQAEEEGYDVENASVGTKTDTAIQDTPQSIQVIPQEIIEDQGASDITEALKNVPGVTPAGSPRSVFNAPVIRGFGGFGAINDIFRRNGLRDPLGTSIGGDTANVERIEVLKGPASVLYGQGSPGGIVNIVTKQPLSESFYEVEASIGNFDLYRGTLDFSGPINESGNLLYRLNIGAETAGNFVDFYDRDLFQIAPVLTWKIGENTDLTFQAEYSSLDNPNYFGIPAIGTVLDNPNGDIPLEFNIAGEAESNKEIDLYRIGYNLEHRFSENWRIRNAFEAGFRQSSEFAVFENSLQPDNRTLERGYFDSREGFDLNAYTLDTYTVGNFNTGSIKHELVAGIELYREETITVDNSSGSVNSIDLFDPDYSNTVLEPPNSFFDDKETKDGLGIYLQDQISFLDNFIVVLGRRFDIVSVENEDFIELTTEFQQNEAFSPRVGIVYKPIPNISVYASYSRSFQQETGRTIDNSIFEPTRGTQYEIGVKGDISDRLSATLSLYDITRSNVVTEDPDNPGFDIQTGEQNSQGVELSFAGEILPGWNITAGYAYTDATITEDNTFESGNRLNNAPENAVSLWTTYEIQQGSLRGLGFGAGIFFVGERQGDLDNSFTVPSYTRTDAVIFYERDKFRTAVNFNNLFDIDYFEFAQNDLRVYPGDPFTVVGSVSYKF